MLRVSEMVLEMINCITGEDLDSVAEAYGLPSRTVKQELFGGGLETDESLRNRIRLRLL